MKKWSSLLAALIVIFLCFSFTSVHAQGWNYVKLFPSNTFQTFNGSGINNGIAVDPMGRLWISSYSTVLRTQDSILSDGAYISVGKVWVFNPNGTQASFSPMKVLNGVDQNGAAVHDTLNGNLLARGTKANGYSSTTGFKRAPDGNMYLTRGSAIIWKLKYTDGTVMQRIVNPIPGVDTTQSGGNGSSFCDIAADGEIFISTVYGGNNIVARSADFKGVDAVVAVSGGFGRAMSVTPDGSHIYRPSYTLLGTLHYQGDPLSGYVFKDTLFKGLTGTCTAWNPKNNYLWLTSGGSAGASSSPPWRPSRVYGFDMTNRSAPVLKDSIVWNLAATFPGAIDSALLEVRGMAFSPTGDTAYLGLFSRDTASIQMFTRKTTSVERQPDGVVNTYELSQNYPNPFNPSTQIKFSLAKSGFTTLRVFDILGRQIAELVSEELTPGTYKATFDAEKFRTGTYIYELRSGDTRLVKKMLLVK